MLKSKKLLFSFGILLLAFSHSIFADESITITTYYPSPYGSYNQLYVATSLGIGTTSPGGKLHIHGGGSFRHTNSNVGDGLFTWFDFSRTGMLPGSGNNYFIETQSSSSTARSLEFSLIHGGDYIFGVTGNARMVIKDSGNVGIGSTAPGYKLDVNGNIGTNYSSLILNPNGGTVGTDGTYGIYWHQSAGTPSSSYGIYRSSGAWTAPYQQLTLSFATGIVMNPGTAYGKSYVDIQGNGLRVTAGNVGIGTTIPAAALDAYTTTTYSGGWMSNLRLSSTTFPSMRFYASSSNKSSSIGNNNDGSLYFGINGTGDIYGSAYGLVLAANGNVTGVYGNYHVSSDIRLKKDVVTISDALKKVLSLRGVDFRWKDASVDTKLHMGMIAQEVEKVVPEVVHTADDKMKTKAVEYEYLVGLLVEAMKEQQKGIQELKERVKSLEAKLNANH